MISPDTDSDQSPYKAGDVIDETYRLESRLGQGGLADVWAAESNDNSGPPMVRVAIRLPQVGLATHPEIRALFETQYRVERALAGPNVEGVTGFGFDEERGIPYLTMRAMTGKTLADHLRHGFLGGAPLSTAGETARGIGLALDHVHGRGYVYSDLKPAKVFLEEGGRIKLFNFVLTRRYRADRDDADFDPGQLGALTPAYAAIEMYQAEDPDPRDDIYALGVVLYQLYGGRHPFEKMSAPKALELGLKPEPIPRLTRRQNRALRDALMFHRKNRPRSAGGLVARLTRSRTLLDRILG